MKWIAVLATLAIASAQEPEVPGSVEGVVRGESGGPPIAGIPVRVVNVEGKTDSNGAYRLEGVRPGRHQMTVGFGPNAVALTTRTVSVQPGKSATAMFSLPLKGTISGKVVDHNDEPMPLVEVVLIGREYGAGAVRYFRRTVARTDDQGEYRMQFVQPGVDYLLLFRHADPRNMKPVSNAPAEPKLRRPTFVPTYYPGSAQREGAAVINLRSGEHREGIDVRLLRSPSFCAEGVLTAGGQPAAMTFHIHEAELSFGIGPSGGTTGIPLQGQSGPDGRIRICDLHPGDYRLTAFTGDINQPESMSTIAVTIKDRDVRNISVTPVPRIPAIPVELTWAGEPPKEPLKPKVRVTIRSITRSFGAFGVLLPAVRGPDWKSGNRMLRVC